jgi:hypothetical protein
LLPPRTAAETPLGANLFAVAAKRKIAHPLRMGDLDPLCDKASRYQTALLLSEQN